MHATSGDGRTQAGLCCHPGRPTIERDVALLKRLGADAVAGHQRHLQQHRRAQGGKGRPSAARPAPALGQPGVGWGCWAASQRLLASGAPHAGTPAAHHVGARVALHHARPVRIGRIGWVGRLAANGGGVEQDLFWGQGGGGQGRGKSGKEGGRCVENKRAGALAGARVHERLPGPSVQATRAAGRRCRRCRGRPLTSAPCSATQRAPSGNHCRRGWQAGAGAFGLRHSSPLPRQGDGTWLPASCLRPAAAGQAASMDQRRSLLHARSQQTSNR